MLLWTEFFGLSRTGTALDQRYPVVTNTNFVQFVPGRFGGRALANLNNGNDCTLETPGFTPVATLIAGAVVNVNGPGVSAGLPQPLFSFRDGSGNEQVRLDLWPKNRDPSTGFEEFTLDVSRDSGPDLIRLDQSFKSFSSRRWLLIEMKLTIGTASTGSWEVRVNGKVVMQGTNLTDLLSSGQIDRVLVGYNTNSINGDEYFWLDGFYVLDTTGTRLNDFLGSFFGEHRLPSADGAVTAWLPSKGTDNYLLVNEEDVDNGDAAYVSTSGTGAIDLYEHPRLTMIRGGVLSVEQQLTARLETAGSSDLQAQVSSGGSTANSASISLSSLTYLDQHHHHEQNPVGPKDWSLSDLDTAELGFEVVP